MGGLSKSQPTKCRVSRDKGSGLPKDSPSLLALRTKDAVCPVLDARLVQTEQSPAHVNKLRSRLWQGNSKAGKRLDGTVGEH